MKRWKVESQKFPYLPFTLSVRRFHDTLEALLDTGFSGEVIVPYSFLSNGSPADNFVSLEIADGSVVSAPAYIGTVTVGGRKLSEVVVVAMGREPIIGRELIKHFKITLDYGKNLIVEP